MSPLMTSASFTDVGSHITGNKFQTFGNINPVRTICWLEEIHILSFVEPIRDGLRKKLIISHESLWFSIFKAALQISCSWMMLTNQKSFYKQIVLRGYKTFHQGVTNIWRTQHNRHACDTRHYTNTSTELRISLNNYIENKKGL